MYHVGKKHHHHRRARRRIVIIIIILLLIALIYWLFNLRIEPDSEIKNSKPVNNEYSVSTEANVTFDKPEFIVHMPGGWEERPTLGSPTGPRYTFVSKVSEARQLDIYIDNPPTGLSLNRVVKVMARGNAITNEMISDNCMTYTDPKNKNPTTGIAPARWQEVDFLCDMGSPTRQLVGMISSDGLNRLHITGQSGRTYKIFITYTDNSISPNYTLLYDTLKDIRFK